MGVHDISRDDFLGRAFVRKLNYLCKLDPEDEDLLTSLLGKPRKVPPGVAVPVPSRGMGVVVCSGCAARVRLFIDGRRQIISLALAGELLNSWVNPFGSDPPIALTKLTLVDLAPLSDALQQTPGGFTRLRKALGLMANLEAAQLVEQVVSLGARPALERTAYWLLDLHHRLTLAGVSSGDSYSLPFTQEMIGDICGMSVVHVNRIFKQMQRENLVRINKGTVSILDAERMKMIAEYEPLLLASRQKPTYMPHPMFATAAGEPSSAYLPAA